MPAPADWTPDELEDAREFIDFLRVARDRGDDPLTVLVLGTLAGSRKTTDILVFSGIRRPSPTAHEPTLRQDSQAMIDTDEDIRLPPLVENVVETTGTDDAILEVLRTCEKPLKRESIAKRAHCTNNTYFFERLKILRQQGLVRCFPGHLYWLAERGQPVLE